MARRFAQRGVGGKIIGSTKWPSDGFPEQIDDQDQDYLDYLDLLANPPVVLNPLRKAPPVPSGNSIPALRDEVAALRQVLIDAGLLDA